MPIAPSAVRHWFDRTRATVSADLAVHGLAYLGVLLLFGGVFGFVAFAFGQVDRVLRPVAELAIAASFFGIAALLRRRGAPFVGDAVTFLGGAVLPVLVIASLSDGAGVPPDPTGATLVVSLVLAELAVAAAYLVVSVRRPASPLRFLVAPVTWVAAAAGGLAFSDPIPTGTDIVTPQPAQWAAAVVAVTVTLVLARRRPSHPVSVATTLAAVPGLTITYLLTVAAAIREDWPAAPLVVAGIAAFLALELLVPRLGRVAVASLEPLLVTVTALTLVPDLGWGIAGAVTAAAVLAIAEGRRASLPAGPAAVQQAVDLALLTGATAAALADPWTAIVVCGGLWGHAVRREHAHPSPAFPAPVAAVAVAVLPFGVATGVARLLEPGPAVSTMALGVLVVAVGVRLLHAGGRALWQLWIPAAAAVVTVAAVAVPEQGWGAAAAVAAAATWALTPRRPVIAVWGAVSSLAVAAVLAALALDLTRVDAAAAIAAPALLAVVLAAVLPRRILGHVGMAGHLAGTATAVLAVPSALDVPVVAATILAVGAWTAGWVVTSLARATSGSTVVDLLARIQDRDEQCRGPLRPTPEDLLPTGLAVPGLAVTAAAATSWAANLPGNDPWVLPAAAGALLLAALLGRWAVAADPVQGRLLHWGATSLLVVATCAAVSEPGAGALVAAAVVGAVAVAGPALRVAVMLWLAWVAGLLATTLAAEVSGVPASSLHLVVLVWGAVALLGSLVLDELLAGRRPGPGWARRASLQPGVVVGALATVGGLVPTFADDRAVWGTWSLVVAGVAAVAAWRCRTPLPTLPAWALLVVAWAGLVPDDPFRPPWPLVLVAAVPTGVAVAIRLFRGGRETPTLAQWDLPALVVAAGTLFTALVAAISVGWIPATASTSGALVLVVAAAYRWPVLVPVGVGLVLLGTGVASRGVLALELGPLAAATTAVAARTHGPIRDVLRWTGVAAAVGCWIAFVDWTGWALERASATTALVAGAALLVLAAAVRLARIGTEWAGPWAVPSVLGLGYAGAALQSPSVTPTTVGQALAAGLAAAAVSAGTSAGPLRQPVLRETAALLLAAAGGVWTLSVDADPAVVVVVTAATGLACAVFVLVAAVRERAIAWIRAALLLGIVATVISVGAGFPAGTGWLAIALLALAADATIAAARRPEPARSLLRLTGAAAGACAWAAFAVHEGWDLEQAATATAPAAGTVALVLAVGLRSGRLGEDWARVWAVPPAAGLGFAVLASTDPAVAPSPAGHALAAGLAAAAVASGCVAAPLGRSWFRDAAAVLGLGAAAASLHAVDASSGAVVAVSITVGAAATLFVVAAGAWQRGLAWVRPAFVVGWTAAAAAVIAALETLPERGFLVAAFLALGLQAAAVGIARRRTPFLLAAPAMFCVAWLVLASEAVAGDPQWYTVPIGLTALVTVGIGRWDLRQQGLDDATPPLVALELVAMALVVGAALIRTATESVLYGPVAIVLGAALAVWGVLTRVRRRVAVGAGTVLLAVVLMLAGPMAALELRISAAALWLTMAAAGLLAILVAAFLERGRAAVRRAVRTFRELTDGWE